MSTWIEQLSTWLEDREALPAPDRDRTVSQIETLICISQEIQEAYVQVVEKLDHERSCPRTETKNR